MATYFKNTELAARYNISEATVRNWVKSAKNGKLQLQISEDGGRTYVTNDVSNIPIIEDLVRQNRKYRNTLASRTVMPRPEFFGMFTSYQIYDIIRNLELHHEIPRQYGYFGKGATSWDEYVNKQMSVDIPSLIRRSIELLSANYSYIDKRVAKFKQVNIVDIGVGNGRPVKELISHLIEEGKSVKYLGLDFSDDMLDIALGNLREWFGEQIAYDRHQLDVAHERFGSLLRNSYVGVERSSVNLFLFLGATPTNLRVPCDAFRTICDSMDSGDILIYTDGIRQSVPEWFEHSYERKPRKPELLDRHKYILSLLNIDESLYTPDIGFDASTNQNYSRARLKYSLNLNFEMAEGSRLISFEKGESLTVWRAWQFMANEVIDLLESAGFYVLHTSQSEDHNYILTIAEVKRS